MKKLKFEKVKTGDFAFDRVLREKQIILKEAQDFLNKFTEVKNGKMSNKINLVCEKLKVDKRTIDLLAALIHHENDKLNEDLKSFKP